LAVDSEIAAPIIGRLGAFVSSLQQQSQPVHTSKLYGRQLVPNWTEFEELVVRAFANKENVYSWRPDQSG
jgi:hypothetical protein